MKELVEELVEEPVEEPVKKPEFSEPIKELGLSEFIKIVDLSSPIIIRILDFKINAFYIAKFISYLRTTVANLKDKLNIKTYKIL